MNADQMQAGARLLRMYRRAAGRLALASLLLVVWLTTSLVSTWSTNHWWWNGAVSLADAWFAWQAFDCIRTLGASRGAEELLTKRAARR